MSENNSTEPLRLKFDPNTIDDLWAKLYSTLPPVIAELIANGYDAGASKIHITLDDTDPENKRIAIQDNWNGMDYNEINESYLVVWRKRRKLSQTHDPIYNRPVMGKKWIWKLSFFGITDYASISTIKNGNLKKISFEMDRSKIGNSRDDYLPKYLIEDTTEEKWTTISLERIKRETNFDVEDIKNSLSNHFIFDSNFRVFISYNWGSFEEITNETRYRQLDIEFSWDFPNASYPYKETILWKIFTGRKPLNKKRRWIALLSRKKLVNLPELFPIDSSSYFYEYLTWYLEVDFIDELEEDVISTDRKTLNWGHPSLSEFENWLQDTIRSLEQDWRRQWTANRQEKIKVDTRIVNKKNTIKTKQTKEELDKTINTIASADVSTEEAIEIINNITPEYQDFHNKNLVAELAEITLPFYKREEFYDAVLNWVKRYITKVRAKISKNDWWDLDVVSSAFWTSAVLSITQIYDTYENSTTRAKITQQTKDTLGRGHFLLTQAMIQAFRNPIWHQEYEDLKNSDIYSAKDCLDALSLLSHLFRRLDNSEII